LAQVIDNTPAVSAGMSAREDLSFADLIFTFSTSVVVGCYPTLIIILAHSKRTVLDAAGSLSLPTMQAASGSTSRTFGLSSRETGSSGKGVKKAIELLPSSPSEVEERESHELRVKARLN
ncbi:hypothetical protein C0991_004086, partial [Blastosporella zonata]